MKFKKCLSAISAGAIAISAVAVSQLVSADAEVNTAAAEAFWGSDYSISASDSSEFAYSYDEANDGVIVTDYLGSADKVKLPAEIDGKPVIEVDFSACFHNFKALIIPDSVQEVALATYTDLLNYFNTMRAASINDFDYYYDDEIKGVVVTGYNKTEVEVKIPEKVKIIDAKDPTKVSEYAVKKVDFTDCTHHFESLVIPNGAEEVIIPNHEEVAIRITDLKEFVSKSKSGKDTSEFIYTNIGVEKVNVPAQLEQIEPGNFSGSTMRTVYIPDVHSTISKWAFSDCYFMTEVVMSNANTVVEDGAFRNCYVLDSIDMTIIDSIGDWAFSGCTKLANVTLSEELNTLGMGAFSRCLSLATVQVPASVTSIGDYAFHGCEELTAVNVAEGNANYVSVDGVLFNKNMTKILNFPQGSKIKSYTIPESVTEISIGAFRDSAVTEVIVPSGVKKIDDGAFENCAKLRKLELPSSVCLIEPGAFNNCMSLKVTYKSIVYKSKSSGEEYDMAYTLDDLYVVINTSVF